MQCCELLQKEVELHTNILNRRFGVIIADLGDYELLEKRRELKALDSDFFREPGKSVRAFRKIASRARKTNRYISTE